MLTERGKEIQARELKVVKAKLARAHEIDVNALDVGNGNMLHCACYLGHIEIVKLLLAHPAVDPNARDTEFMTPLAMACVFERDEVFKFMLEDERIDINAVIKGETSMALALRVCAIGIAKLGIASGREFSLVGLDILKIGNSHLVKHKDHNATYLFAERLYTDHQLTRFETQMELGHLHVPAAEAFALVVFMCEDLLTIKPGGADDLDHARKFLSITQRLPMELQMIVCNRFVGSLDDHVLSKDSERAFGRLAQKFVKVVKV